MRDEIRAASGSGTLPKFITRVVLDQYRSDGGARSTVLARELVAAHNEGDVDLLEVAKTLPADRADGYDFWLVQEVYAGIITDLNAEPAVMIAAVRSLNEIGGSDMAAGRANHPFRDWMVRTGNALAVLALLDPASTDDIVLQALALEAIAKEDARAGFDAANMLLAAPNGAGRIAAVLAIGRFDLSTDAVLTNRAMVTLRATIDEAPEDRLTGVVLAAAVDTYRRAPAGTEEPTLALIAAAAQIAGAETIHRCATILYLSSEGLSDPIIAALVAIAREVQADNKGTIREIDHAVGQLLRRGHREAALGFLEPVLIRGAADFNDLGSTSYALLELDQSLLAPIVLRWLLSGHNDLGDATRMLVGNAHRQGPVTFSIDFAPEGMEPTQAVFLARKTIGFLFIQPITAASILVSLLRTGPSAAADAIAELLFDPLLINFSGGLSAWIREQFAEPADNATPHLRETLAKLDRYLNGLRAVGPVPELRPSERERLIERQRQRRSMQVAHKAAEKTSIIGLIATRQVLLYGNRSISYFEGPDGSRQRNEMKLGQITTSMEAPRLDILEPVSLDYELRVYRNERMIT